MAENVTTLSNTLEQIADSFQKFKANQEQRFDLLETRMSRPGQAHNTPSAAPTGDRTQFIDTASGETLTTIKAGDNVQRLMESRNGGMSNAEADDTFADFLRGVAGMKVRSELSRKAMSTGTDASGGYLLPTMVFGNVLQAMTAESTVMNAGAQVVLLNGPDQGAKSYTFAAIDTIPTASWRAEAGNVAESDPAFRNVTVVPRSLAFFFKVSRELLADASNLNSAVQMACAQAFAKEMDRTALMGTGTAPEPRGLLNTAGIQSVTNGANGASLATTKFANLFSATQAILDANGPMPSAAIMSHRSRVGLAQLTGSDGQPLQVPPMLQGIAQLSTSQIPNNLTVGTSTDCTQMFVGEFRHMGYAVRENFSIRAMEETFATTGQVGFFCHARVDVFVQYPGAFAKVTGIRP